MATMTISRRLSQTGRLFLSRDRRRVPLLTLPTRICFSSYPPHDVVGLPSLSPTMESGSIASWNVNVGDTFGAGDIFCSIETDKATMDFEAQDDGAVAKILAEAGPAEMKVGDPIMVIVDDEADVPAFADYTVGASASPEPAPSAEPAPTETAPSPPIAAAPAGAPPAAPAAADPAAASAAEAGGRVVASPLARMLAKDLGHDVNAIIGTGPGGRVIAADVREFVPSEAPPVTAAAAAVAAPTAAPAPPAQQLLAAAPPVAGAGYTDYPLSESAREIAARLVQAKRNVPHYYLTVDVSVDELLKTRSSLNSALDEDGQLGVYELLIKASAMSMKTVPSANASWMESVVRVYDSVDINVVIGSGDAMYTPVIRACGGKGLKEISSELKNAIAALEGSEEDEAAAAAPVVPLSSGGVGTFTVMNFGMYGIKSCAPIIREPQACALAIGSLENRIVPNDDDPESEQIYKESVMMTATLSCDHRVVDGAVGAQWLAAFKSHVENPSTLLL